MTTLDMNEVSIEWLGHASFKIRYKTLTILIDPFQIKEEQEADIVCITHEHYDHCSVEALQKVCGEGTTVITVTDCESKVRQCVVGELVIINRGEEKKVIKKENEIKIEAVAAYNIHKQFHPNENEWIGFILEINNTRIYHAGDTDLIPEMETYSADIALLPVGGTYTMNATEAAEAVKAIQPKIAVPMHYGSIVGSAKDAEEFKSLVKEAEVRILS